MDQVQVLIQYTLQSCSSFCCCYYVHQSNRSRSTPPPDQIRRSAQHGFRRSIVRGTAANISPQSQRAESIDRSISGVCGLYVWAGLLRSCSGARMRPSRGLSTLTLWGPDTQSFDQHTTHVRIVCTPWPFLLCAMETTAPSRSNSRSA